MAARAVRLRPPALWVEWNLVWTSYAVSALRLTILQSWKLSHCILAIEKQQAPRLSSHLTLWPGVIRLEVSNMFSSSHTPHPCLLPGDSSSVAQADFMPDVGRHIFGDKNDSILLINNYERQGAEHQQDRAVTNTNHFEVRPSRRPQKEGFFSQFQWTKSTTNAEQKDAAETPQRDGYNVDYITGLLQTSNSNNIFEHATTMRVTLERELEHHNVPIIFVVHSLGGVIVKDVINISDFLRDRTKLVIFFGTPHRGNANAGWGELAATFGRYFFFLDTNASLVRDLALHNQILDRIHRQFVENITSKGIRIHSFQESRMTGALRSKIVENFSSRMDIGKLETVEAIDADHSNMVKFSKDTDAGYKAVLKVLEFFIRQIVQSATPPAPPTPAAPTDLHHPVGDQPRGAPLLLGQPPRDDGSQMTRPTDIPSVDTTQPAQALFLDTKDHENIQKFSSDYPAARSGVVDRFPGTCEWIVQHAEFERWSKAGDISTPLWISGHPGMGKTVMSKFLLDHFEQMDPPHQTLYFFFNDRDNDKKTAVSFLKAAIHQLIQHSQFLYHTYVKVKLAAFGDRLYDSFGMLWDVFFDMTQDPVLGPTLCVIDALDECETVSRQELISRIGRHFSPTLTPEASSRASKTFKLLLTSRPYGDILANWSHFHIIHLRTEREDFQINSDIGLFVETEVERLSTLRGYSEELQDTVGLALVEGADGMFLWAALMVKVLETTPVSRVRERLASLPSGIDELYDRILAEVPEDLVSTVSAILKWVAFAFRPLSIDELGVACALDSAPYESIASIPEEVRTGIRGDLGLCGPILKVKNDHVHLVHQTTKEYLVRRCVTDTAIGALIPTPRAANSQLALACMRFINSAEVDDVMARAESQRGRWHSEPVPFTNYASSYWGSHVCETGTITEDDLLWLELCLALESAAKLRWLADTTIGCYRNPRPVEYHLWREWFNNNFLSPVHILLDCECESASALYTKSGQYKASTQDASGRFLLHMATERGFHQVMIDLLRTEPDAANLYQGRKGKENRSTDSVTSTPLHIAATRGDVAAIEILLRNGASVDKAETRWELRELFGIGTTVVQTRTALHCATTGNHLAAVRRLLDASAGIDDSETKKEELPFFGRMVSMSEDWTALHAAASLNFVAISHLLLQRGAATVTGSDGRVFAPYEYTKVEPLYHKVCELKPRWPNGRVALQGRLR
ncbi:hypothetical protein B0T11DRAFT_319313 [Plectosphaerella cucumerina]|uniref:NACHT domain-containing protein n=1 Tax=Plectosphaerella cucumerina TaxID=40658 RepID=A0A8K0X280_9PEZI|nr:hypothetical protein B0T11DRAFT_319313 [Plectosphaerella cucumerina]